MKSYPWKGSPVPASMAIHGLSAVRLTAKALDPTARLLTETLGFRQSGTYLSEQHSTVYVFEVGTGGPGTEVHLDVRPELPFGRPGIGGVHHLAFRTPNEEEQLQWRNQVVRKISNVTASSTGSTSTRSTSANQDGAFRDRYRWPRFHSRRRSRTPGRALSLPPFLETHRQEIEENLRPIVPFHFAALS